ncbi:MAG TPA: NTP transferase domain-containing protein [Candidatus Acidoferrum sp.]|jgi:choline kinase
MLTSKVAVILAAGLGTRINIISGYLPKPLVRFEGIPLLEHVMSGAKQAGIERFVIVIGHQGQTVRRWFEGSSLRATPVTWVDNRDYHKKNGISLLKARHVVNGPFLLLMSDHIFEPKTAESLLRQRLASDEVILGVDHKLDCIFDLDDATKVVRWGDHIIRIGKNLKSYDAVDTGMFLCNPAVFNALEAVMKDGNCSLSDGMQHMASQRKLRAYDIEDAIWQDIDTPEMLDFAQVQLRPQSSVEDVEAVAHV